MATWRAHSGRRSCVFALHLAPRIRVLLTIVLNLACSIEVTTLTSLCIYNIRSHRCSRVRSGRRQLPSLDFSCGHKRVSGGGTGGFEAAVSRGEQSSGARAGLRDVLHYHVNVDRDFDTAVLSCEHAYRRTVSSDLFTILFSIRLCIYL